MFTIGNNELAECKKKIGKTIKCPTCGKRHRVRYGKSPDLDGAMRENTSLAFYKCGETSYLCGVQGIDITSKALMGTTGK